VIRAEDSFEELEEAESSSGDQIEDQADDQIELEIVKE